MQSLLLDARLSSWRFLIISIFDFDFRANLLTTMSVPSLTFTQPTITDHNRPLAQETYYTLPLTDKSFFTHSPVSPFETTQYNISITCLCTSLRLVYVVRERKISIPATLVFPYQLFLSLILSFIRNNSGLCKMPKFSRIQGLLTAWNLTFFSWIIYKLSSNSHVFAIQKNPKMFYTQR